MASFRSTNIGRVLWLVTIYGGLLFASSAMSRLTVAQSSGPDPADLLRQFDVDGDGKVTVAEGGPGAQQFVRRMLEMAGKNADDSLNLEDIRRVVGLHRRQSQRTPPGANTDRPPAANPSRDARPSAVPAGRSRNTRPNRPVTPSGPLQSRLAGTWRGWVVDGRGENPDGGHMQMELRVEGNRMFGREIGTQRAPQGLGDGEFTIAGSGDSGTLDAVATTGQHAGREYLGIFRLEGDTLHWCVNNRNGARPTEHETGRGNYYMILRRQP
jgi:uncharacterized protein (TIGR03067 family)